MCIRDSNQIEGHIIVSCVLVLLQNSLYLSFNGFQIFHRLPPYMERGRLINISRPFPVISGYFFFLFRILSHIAAPTINTTSTMAIMVLASINQSSFFFFLKQMCIRDRYSIVEVQAPYGYVLNSEPVYFDVDVYKRQA